MTEAPLNHPGDAALRALSLGQLAEAELAQVSAHLGACPACCRRIDQLASDDPLLARLQHGAASRDEVLVSPAQRRPAVRALRHSHEARSAARERDPEAGTVSGVADASAVQTHRDAPRGLPDRLTRFLAPPERPDEIGRLGPYRVLAVLAQGGMGVVFRGHDPALDRPVALKAMLPGMAAVPNARERFLREARAAAALKHPHVVTIFQVGEDRGVPFLAMEFLEGEPLDTRIRREGRLPLAEVLRIGRETALALAAAHARGLVHRDVKPANLWLESVGDSLCESQPTRSASGLPSVKVLDFGLAWTQADQAHLTQSGLIVGTPAYMAPEQAEGKPVNPRCDLFSLGCVLYQMCTGSLPFHGASTIAVLRALALHEPPPVGELRPETPRELSALVVRLLAKNPEGRPASAEEVAEELHALEQLPTRSILPKPKARPARKSRKLLVAIAGAALALALMLVLWPTPHGTVRIESDDPAVEVVFGKDGPTIKGADKEPITLRAGEHGVVIKRGDFTFEADKLVLKKGAALTLKVELLRGKVQVLQDGQVVAAQTIPLPAPPPGGKRGDPLAGWLQEVAALPAEEQVKAVAAKLKDLNPGFDGQVTRTIEGGVVTHFSFLTDHVTNITPLRALTGVTTLDLSGSNWGKGQLADLEPLRGMRLTRLSFFASKGVADLSPLAGMKLASLDCSGTAVTDLEPLRGMPLENLNCRECPGIQSLAPLQGMPLKRLDCSRTHITDLTPLHGMKLDNLAISYTPVSDLSPLRGMKLTTLGCKGTNVTDLSVLRGLPLKFLFWDFRAERDAAILRSLEALERIDDKPVAEFWKEVDAKPGAQKP
jgi:serine/threonine protein kinase